MVLIITGSTHTGKTLAAQRALEKYSCPYLSIDHLKMGLIRSGICALTPDSPERELTRSLWPIVKEIIKTVIENGQDLVVEGCYIPFGWEEGFEQAYLEQIRYVCLIFSEGYIKSHYDDIINFAGAIEQRLDDDDCTKEKLLQQNKENIEKCRQYGYEYLLIDSAYHVDITI